MEAQEHPGLQIFPDELLLEIFQYLSVEDLVNNIRNVCSRWRNVTQANKLWKNISYKPPSTKCDDEIISFLKLMPQLRIFIFNSCCFKVDGIINTLCSQCKHLHTLICDCVVITTIHLQKISECLPNLESLQLSQWQMIDETALGILGQFQSLKKLTCVNIGPASTYISNGTPVFKSLEHVEMIAYCTEDLLTHGREQANSWNSFHFLHLLPEFMNLKHLSIDFRMLHFSGFETVFCNINKLKNLKTICFKSLFHSDKEILTKMFSAGSLPKLWKIDLSNCLNLHLRTVQAISKSCPNVQEIRFSRCVYFDDKCAEALVSFPLLRWLDLSCCNRVSETGLAALARCPKLEALDLSWRAVVPHRTLRVVSTFPKLKALVLNHTEILPKDIEELLITCPHIVYLGLYCCSGVDGDSLQKRVPHCKISCNRLQEVYCPYSKILRLNQ